MDREQDLAVRRVGNRPALGAWVPAEAGGIKPAGGFGPFDDTKGRKKFNAIALILFRNGKKHTSGRIQGPAPAALPKAHAGRHQTGGTGPAAGSPPVLHQQDRKRGQKDRSGGIDGVLRGFGGGSGGSG